MSQAKEYLTQTKFDELTKELKFLVHEKRKAVAQNLEHAKSLGDLSENAEYQEARDEQAQVEARIAQLEYILKNAEILNHVTGDVIEAGSTIVLQKKGEKETQTFLLVGSEEADMAQGKLSYQSPLGAILLRKKKGEEITFETPRGVVHYKIVDVN